MNCVVPKASAMPELSSPPEQQLEETQALSSSVDRGLDSDVLSDAKDRESDRRARLFNPIVVLTKTTKRLTFDTAITVTANEFATVTFAGCVPSDVSSIIGPSCVFF